ncbi:MAG TPA: FliA/WhiG family RNA polymerase sigma factor [Povalibacter sp.]|uniref:FliA/WhiG family RNA polymerase sigma factor n=1 Tax=Povalibacter sp. TaxID=1962978 RepID=UPI002B6DD4F0|nr:FliA/WhiG family RNA polymerase sigma factor [Povalibacter sp.]HMN43146.1 FliA/WhiG family RNA polymerase sigma factor [Povalibacter sp.]
MSAVYAEADYAACVPHNVAEEQRYLLAYVPLVKRVVRQLLSQAGGAMDRDDMQQVGLVGLLDALRRYWPPDEKFGSYAALRVRGAILDELRRQDWRPRAVRQESHRTRDGIRDLTRRLGREPSVAEIQQALGLSAAAYRDYELAQNAESLANFDELLHEMDGRSDGGGSPETQLLTRRSIEQALQRLDAREQRVVQLYYEFDLSLKEIAAVLELTEARVCQINKAALRKMRETMADDGGKWMASGG